MEEEVQGSIRRQFLEILLVRAALSSAVLVILSFLLAVGRPALACRCESVAGFRPGDV